LLRKFVLELVKHRPHHRARHALKVAKLLQDNRGVRIAADMLGLGPGVTVTKDDGL
jgi:hypothetical protein